MLHYLLKRFFLAIPTLALVSVLVFVLSRSMPGDPVENILTRNGFEVDKVTDFNNYEVEYQKVAKAYHFDLPIFYFSIRKKVLKSYVHYPKFKWNGLKNQYHYWLEDFLSGKSMRSAKDNRLVKEKIGTALSWSLSLAFIALFIIMLLSIPLGKHLYMHRPKFLQVVLYAIYSVPVFWMATLLLTFFTTPEYGWWTNIFPPPGVWEDNESFGASIIDSGQKLILPLICIIAHDLTYISRMLQNSMLAEQANPYIITAKGKGLSKHEVVDKHLFPNAKIPLVTIIIDAIPRSIAGTLIIEVIFNLPGMGRLLYDSINYHDWNVLIAILMLIACITVITYIIGDLVYAKVNPKIEIT